MVNVKHHQKVAVPFGTSDFKALDLRLKNVAFFFTLTSFGLSQCEPLLCSTKMVLQRQKGGKSVTYTFNDAAAETTCEVRSSTFCSFKVFLRRLSLKAHEGVCRHHLRIPSSKFAVFLHDRFLSFRNPGSVCCVSPPNTGKRGN